MGNGKSRLWGKAMRTGRVICWLCRSMLVTIANLIHHELESTLRLLEIEKHHGRGELRGHIRK